MARPRRVPTPTRERDDDSHEPGWAQMIVGGLGAAAVICLLLLIQQERWTLSWLDGAFWLSLAAMGVVRRLSAAPPAPAPKGGLRSVLVAVLAALAWAGAQALGDPPS